MNMEMLNLLQGFLPNVNDTQKCINTMPGPGVFGVLRLPDTNTHILDNINMHSCVGMGSRTARDEGETALLEAGSQGLAVAEDLVLVRLEGRLGRLLQRACQPCNGVVVRAALRPSSLSFSLCWLNLCKNDLNTVEVMEALMYPHLPTCPMFSSLL